MRHDSTSKILKLIQLLTDTRSRSVEDMCERLEMSKRSFYYTLNFLKNDGFTVFKRNGCYHIDHRSPFVAGLVDSVQLTNDELLTIRNLLDLMGDQNVTVNNLKRKLDSAYDFDTIVNTPEARRSANIVKKLTSAIEQKKVVRIIDYSSPNSHTNKDRMVEPFLMMNSNRDVRCHELTSGMNKTFKIARMGDIEVLNMAWLNEEKHKQVFTDIFMFSGEVHYPVRIRVGQLAYNLFIEEYPQGRKFVHPCNGIDNQWLIELEVCDFRGIGRFVMGLYQDVTVLGNEEFRDYIRRQIESMGASLNQQ